MTRRQIKFSLIALNSLSLFVNALALLRGDTSFLTMIVLVFNVVAIRAMLNDKTC